MTQPDNAPAERLDLVVRGGRVLDPGRGVDAVLDVGIAGGRIARVPPRSTAARPGAWSTRAASSSFPA